MRASAFASSVCSLLILIFFFTKRKEIKIRITIKKEKDSRAGRFLAKCGRGSKRKSPGWLCAGATAAVAARLRPKGEESPGTGRRGHCRAVCQVQVCFSGGPKIPPVVVQDRRHYDPVHWGLCDVLGNLVCGRVCLADVRSRVRTFAGRKTFRHEGKRADVYSIYGRGHPAEGGAAQCVGRIGHRHRRAVAGFGGSAAVRGPLPHHGQPDVPQPRLQRLFPQFV